MVKLKLLGGYEGSLWRKVKEMTESRAKTQKREDNTNRIAQRHSTQFYFDPSILKWVNYIIKERQGKGKWILGAEVSPGTTLENRKSGVLACSIAR